MTAKPGGAQSAPNSVEADSKLTQQEPEPYVFPSGLEVSGWFSEPAGELPSDTTVLHIGDSFAGALGIDLNKLFRARGIRGVLKYEVPSYIPQWASGADLRKYLSKYKPDLVLITLGANEMEIVEPENRAPKIQKLVSRLGDIPCVWIAPALWGKDNGLMQVVRENVQPCRFLDTNTLVRHMPRAGDGIHPNMAARPDWAEFVLRWLAKERAIGGEKPWTLRPEERE